MDRIYMGLDVHYKPNLCYAARVDGSRMVVYRRKFLNTRKGVEEFVAELDNGDSVVIEAGTYWQHIYDALERAGVGVCLSHPLKTKVIAEAGIKKNKDEL